MNNNKHRYQQNKEWVGIFIIVIGVMFLGRSLGFALPSWLFSWPMFFVALGLTIGFKTKFKNSVWLMLTGFGSLFLIDDIFGYDIRFSQVFFPALLIVLGIRMIRKPKQKMVHQFDEESGNFTELKKDESLDDKIELIAVFAGNKKILVSKNFKGGELISVFGGNEINMTKCDINGRVNLEVVQVFGGTKLIIPSNWRIQSEIASVFGGLDDKRNIIDFDSDDSKVLVISGVSVLGGIDIRSY